MGQNRNGRILYSATLFSTIAVMTMGCDHNSDKKEKPNIILMMADDLGYNDLSCYRVRHDSEVNSPPTSQTPNIDQLASQGLLFTDFYAGAAVCSPSRAALLTGRNATRVGIYNWIPGNSPMHLRGEEHTLGEVLKADGYQTAHFGKWHLTSDFDKQPGPQQQGFDYALYTQNNAEPSHHNPVNFILNGEEVGPSQGYASHLVVDEAIGWLQEHEDSSDPFYLNVWFHEPHVVCAAPEKFTSRHSYHQNYYGAIENMDEAVGKLMSYLEKVGLEENTLVIFTSDNGSQVRNSNLPLSGEKCLNLEGGIRVPFIIRWPGNIHPGKTTEAIGSLTDVLPTISELTGATIPGEVELDGISLVQILTAPDRKFEREKPVFSYRYFHDPICMLRDGDWILTGYDELFEYDQNFNLREHAKFKPQPSEPQWSQWGFQQTHMKAIPDQEPRHFSLFNIKEDPYQQNNLAGQHPGKTEEMKNKMLEFKRKMVEEGGNWFEEAR